MRISVLACALLTGCSTDVAGLDGQLSGGTGGSGVWHPVEHPDFPLEARVEPDKLDLPPLDACSSLDILFVVDNSGSMAEDQERLAVNIPTFVERLVEIGVGAQGGIHLGVVTTDAYLWNSPDKCKSIGALVTQTGGGGASQQVCGPYAEGHRFMTEADDLEESFPCAAAVGSAGSSSERAADALIEALDDWQNRPGGCNEEFHRVAWTNGDFHEDRAGLVVVIITDEDDATSIGEAWEWAEHLAWIRGGSLEDTAFLAILPDQPCTNAEATKLNEFMDEVPYSLVGSICDEDFAEFFADAVPFVAAGCGIEPEPEP